jgi:hypothetical protein
LPNSEGTIAATDRLQVRSGHTRVTLAQVVAQFQRKSFVDEYAIGDRHYGRALRQNYFASISRGFEAVTQGAVLISAQFGIQSRLLSVISCEYDEFMGSLLMEFVSRMVMSLALSVKVLKVSFALFFIIAVYFAPFLRDGFGPSSDCWSSSSTFI